MPNAAVGDDCIAQITFQLIECCLITVGICLELGVKLAYTCG